MARHRPQGGRPSVLRIGVAALPRLAATMPWLPLLAGCLVGLAVSVAGRFHASPTDPNPVAGLLICRAGFAPVVAGLAFLLADPHRPVIAAMPAPAWLTTAMRVLLAVPVVALTSAVQLGLAAAGQRVMLQARQPALPWISLAAELAAWSALALAVGAMLGRTRWHDVSGAFTVPSTLAAVAVLAQLPWKLFPAVVGTRAAGPAWARAGWLWAVVCAASLGVIALSSRDPWLRLRLRYMRLSSLTGIEPV